MKTTYDYSARMQPFAVHLATQIKAWYQVLDSVLPKSGRADLLKDVQADYHPQDIPLIAEQLLSTLVEDQEHFQSLPPNQVVLALGIELMSVVVSAYHVFLLLEKLDFPYLSAWDVDEIPSENMDEYIALEIMNLAAVHDDVKHGEFVL